MYLIRSDAFKRYRGAPKSVPTAIELIPEASGSIHLT
jgi:hypothetical protein